MAFNPYDKYGLLIPRWFRLSYAPDITGESMRRLKVECDADQVRYDTELDAVLGAIARGERAEVPGQRWFVYHPEEENDGDGPYLPVALEARLAGLTVEAFIARRDAPEPPPPPMTREDHEFEEMLAETDPFGGYD